MALFRSCEADFAELMTPSGDERTNKQQQQHTRLIRYVIKIWKEKLYNKLHLENVCIVFFDSVFFLP